MSARRRGDFIADFICGSVVAAVPLTSRALARRAEHNPAARVAHQTLAASRSNRAEAAWTLPPLDGTSVCLQSRDVALGATSAPQ
eukprot:CAMPEP_0181171842 /NCGR_PEP_ID=MMETSP1096-20121128/2128_1 /TAXON_ID=156174 ORGANISM="Chrysochromulina ericina, Strain CCMP281" /NCGR_SAMPLE_ID=MMETSP1096 /ASSEMBLY_ACC=CAM_ASM_000453 /LENGTH=84 /DNA_ID=CAMNT_0023259523 /DNA_START=967 /DNA_END=1222 /DNA_ORIENTATION=-